MTPVVVEEVAGVEVAIAEEEEDVDAEGEGVGASKSPILAGPLRWPLSIMCCVHCILCDLVISNNQNHDPIFTHRDTVATVRSN